MDSVQKRINKEGKVRTPMTASFKRESEWLKAKLLKVHITQETKSSSNNSSKVCAASSKLKMKWIINRTAKTLKWKENSKVK